MSLPDAADEPPSPDAGAGTATEPGLPETVARRVVVHAVMSVRAMPDNQVPAALRFARHWHPTRVPAAARQRILDALADEGVRRRVAGHLREQSESAELLGQGGPGPGGEDEAALLVLVRPPGWLPRFEDLVAQAARGRPVQTPQVENLRRIEALEQRLAKQQQRSARELREVREEAAAERARLTAEAVRLREQGSATALELATAEAARDRRADEAAELSREVRRLRSQLEAMQGRLEQQRTQGREARSATTARVQMLLQVLRESAAGLALELEVPGPTPLPADLVPAASPSPAALPARITTSADLAAALGLPRCHLIVDGYNITKGSWPNAPLQSQRDRLVALLGPLVSRTGAEATVVFDGAEVGPAPPVAPVRGVRVRFSEPGEIADRLIVRLAGAEPGGRPVVVASSDTALGAGARSAGARTCDREVLAAVLGIVR